MKITEKKIEQVESDVIKDIVCNLCGESCMASDGMNTTECSVQADGCYSSAFPPDLETWKFDLCEHCLVFLVSRFKIYPAAFEMTNAHFVHGGVPEPISESEYDSTRELVMRGKMLDVDTKIGETTYLATSDWRRMVYAKGMAKGSLFTSDEIARRATEAAAQAGSELERQRNESRRECHAMHDALNKIACPGSGSVLERVQLLKNEPLNDRLMTMIRDLHEILNKHFNGGEIDRQREAHVLTNSQMFLQDMDEK